MMKKSKADQIFVSLLAGAIGDSLGADIEFHRGLMISSRQNLKMSTSYGVKGAITDDTQMTLFTAEGIGQAFSRNADDVVKGVQDALVRWYGTQNRVKHKFGLASDDRMIACRAPGNSCLTSLGQIARKENLPAAHSKGCGTIMRVAPIGLAFDDPDVVYDLAVKTSKITHTHPVGYIPAAVWAVLISQVRQGFPLDYAFAKVPLDLIRLAEEIGFMPNLERIMKRADAGEKPTRKWIESFGDAFHADSAFYIALIACLFAESFEDGLRMAILHSGDSDTTGAIAGNMLGLMFPEQVLNSQWVEQIECLDLISDCSGYLA